MARTIIIGDVHGCADELSDLLRRVAVDADDRVVMVGDLVVRGPEPARVLDIVRRIGARSVRGNHEDRLLRWRRLHGAATIDPPRSADEPQDPSLASSWLQRTAESLEAADWALLEAMPLWLDLPEHQLRVVHAGVVEGLPMSEHDPRTLMYIRSIDGHGGPSERRDGGVPWGSRYAGPPHVVFGHNALPRPQLHPAATGIDTGCVYGGALTALVLDAGQPVPAPDRRSAALVSVAARRAHVAIASGAAAC